MFGKKNYSKERYEEAKKNADTALMVYRFRGGAGEAPQWVYDGLIKDCQKADKKVRSMYESGMAEAIELNNEYNNLKKKVDDSIQELEVFKRDKLGI